MKVIHRKKLSNIGINNEIAPCDPNKVIFNYSSCDIPNNIKTILAFGLDFCLPIYKLNYYKFFLPLEKVVSHLKDKFGSKNTFPDFLREIQSTSFRYYYGFKSEKIFSAFFDKRAIGLLKNFSQNKDIIVTKPDKGRGVVILNKHDYINSMNKIISDVSKFAAVDESFTKFTMKIEDKINRFLLKLKNLKSISDDIYSKLRATGSSPGILYGLPKIHKLDFSSKFQFRPIFAAYNTPSYNISKFLVPILSKLTVNEYTVENSFKFCQDVGNLSNSDNLFMASFDVENLFTNVPLNETINIILDQLFTLPNSTVIGLTKDLFKNLLELSVLNSFFIFNGKLYKQIEGLGMGLPLGPTFANIFMCFMERNWLIDCPLDFKPVYYKRYVDDSFLLFKDKSHILLFQNYLNNKHPNIKFTCEYECNSKL